MPIPLSVKNSSCPGCGAMLPDVEGPTHGYIESSPACWATYGEVLAREYAHPGLMKAVHRLTVDTYAVQHPGRESPRSLQSVALHLMSLCTLLEEGSDAEGALRMIREGVKAKGRYAWLVPPPSLGALTVVDVGRSKDPSKHEKRVREWASSVWSAWAPHHAVVRGWCLSLRNAAAANR
jgi:hypothetical protein